MNVNENQMKLLNDLMLETKKNVRERIVSLILYSFLVEDETPIGENFTFYILETTNFICKF